MGHDTAPSAGIGGTRRDDCDDARLRHARDRHTGFAVGQYLQPPPMLFTRDGHNVFLGDMYRGQSAFLICAGPSLKTHDLALLNRRGLLTCAVNNAATVVRPQLWTSVDDPGNFCDAIWRDSGILKFVPLCHMEKPFMVRDGDDRLVPSTDRVGDMPAIFGFRRNESFVPEQWLHEDTFNWGNHSDHKDEFGNKGSRSIMYVALRLLFYLGVRRVYLLGCDFRMQVGEQNYAFEQDRTASSVRSNNSSYRILNSRLAALKPHFDREGFEVLNCTPESGLTVFPHVPYESAIEQASSGIPRKIVTEGMYDRGQRERDAAKAERQHGVTMWQERNGHTAQEPNDGDLPPFTLVTAVDGQNTDILRWTWQTWMRYRPALRNWPTLILHDQHFDPRSSWLWELLKQGSIRFVPWNVDSEPPGRDRWSRAYLEIARQIETPWYLKLEPEAIATAEKRWLFPEWFEPNAKGERAVFIASPWGYTKPADAIARLDEWGDRVAELRQHPRLNLPFDPADSRVRHDASSTWCFYGDTAWTREIANYMGEKLPCPAHDTYVYYCAARRGDRTIRARMKDLGWEHSFSGKRRIIPQCRELLQSEEFARQDQAAMVR